MRPTFFAGQELPFGQLGPNEFAQFVTGVLSAVGSGHGFHRVEKTSGPTDDGFDAQARRLADDKIVAIQCKRMQGSLNTAHVGLELAKVALQAAVEGSKIGEHRFITSGKVAKELDSARRARDRRILLEQALRSLREADQLRGKLRDALARGLDSESCVTEYVRAVEIVVWSGEQFHLECRRAWLTIENLVAQFFTVTNVVHEVPRLDFEEARHLDALLQLREPHWILLGHKQATVLPPGLRPRSEANPLKRNRDGVPSEKPVEPSDQLLESLVQIPAGRYVVLIGEGGSGKTTTLKMAAALAAVRRQENPRGPLPFLIALQDYRGDLDRLIHDSAAITRGTWRSLGGPITVFADGLNEVPARFQAALTTELQNLRGRAALVLSVRPSGLRAPLVLPGFWRAVELHRLNRRQTIKIVSRALLSESAPKLLAQLRERQRSRRSSLTRLPFGLAEAIEHFRRHGSLPPDDASFLESFLYARYQRDRELTQDEEKFELVRWLAESVAYEMRVGRQVAALSRAEAQEALQNAVLSARTRHLLGAEELSPTSALRLLRDHEVLVPSADERWFRFRHDLIADYLAAVALSTRWREGLPQLQRSSMADDSFVFAAARVPVHERLEFLRRIAAIDLPLAAECSVTIGHDMEVEVLRMAEQERLRPGVYPRARAATAVGTLQIAEANDWLHAQLEGQAWEVALKDNDTYPFVVALARRGDERLLRHIHPDLENIVSGPGEFSGGIRWLWDIAPAMSRLALAREWLAGKAESETIVLSIRVLAAEGDESDLAVLERVMVRNSNLRTVLEAFRALCALGAEGQAELLLRQVEPHSSLERALITRERAYAETAVDIGAIIASLVEALPEDREQSQAMAYQVRAVLIEALNRVAMDEAATAQLKDAYEKHPAQRDCLWQVAIHHQLAAFEPIAAGAAATDEPFFLARACDFATTRPAGSAWRQKIAGLAQARLEEDPAVAQEPWVLSRVLSFLAIERPERAAQMLEVKLRDISRCFEDLLAGRSPTLMWQGHDMLGPMGNPPFRRGLNDILRELLPPASLVAELLAVECRLVVFDAHVRMFSGQDVQACRQLLRTCPAVVLDERLERIQDKLEAQPAALAIISPLGLTEKRRRLLLDRLPAAVTSIVNGDRLAPVVAAYWCEEVAVSLVRSISNADFTYETLDKLIDAAIEQSDPDLVERLVRPYVGQARTAYGNRMLEIWAESVCERRG
jgi:hypothetical protein